jgi:hypothetical protein
VVHRAVPVLAALTGLLEVAPALAAIDYTGNDSGVSSTNPATARASFPKTVSAGTGRYLVVALTLPDTSSRITRAHR